MVRIKQCQIKKFGKKILCIFIKFPIPNGALFRVEKIYLYLGWTIGLISLLLLCPTPLISWFYAIKNHKNKPDYVMVIMYNQPIERKLIFQHEFVHFLIDQKLTKKSTLYTLFNKQLDWIEVNLELNQEMWKWSKEDIKNI